jgi:hypothetical protein
MIRHKARILRNLRRDLLTEGQERIFELPTHRYSARKDASGLYCFWIGARGVHGGDEDKISQA